jgi:Tfp pilus assembly protein PilF
LISLAKENPLPRRRAKMIEAALAFLEHSADDWYRNNLIYLFHPDEQRAEEAYLRTQELSRALIATGTDWEPKLHVAGPQLARVFPHVSGDSDAFALVKQAYDEDGKDQFAVWANFGWALYRQEKFDEALKWFERTETHSSFATAIYAASGMALTHLKLGRPESARAYYDQVIGMVREKNLLDRELVTTFREVAAAFDDQAAAAELIQDRWPAAVLARQDSTAPP